MSRATIRAPKTISDDDARDEMEEVCIALYIREKISLFIVFIALCGVIYSKNHCHKHQKQNT